jgi:hypothetical protein
MEYLFGWCVDSPILCRYVSCNILRGNRCTDTERADVIAKIAAVTDAKIYDSRITQPFLTDSANVLMKYSRHMFLVTASTTVWLARGAS